MKRKVKILSVIESLGNGGAEQLLVSTLGDLQKNSFHCYVLTLFSNDDLASMLEEKGIQVFMLNVKHKWNLPYNLYKYNKVVKVIDPDIIHSHLFFSTLYTGLYSCFIKRINTIVSFHNLDYDLYPATTLWRLIRKKLHDVIVNRCFTKRVAVSSMVKDHFLKHLNCKSIEIIPNSFNIQGIQSCKNNQNCFVQYFGRNEYETIVVTPGRLVKQKGHNVLLDAIIVSNESDCSIGFLIIGSGPLEVEIQKIIDHKNLANVKLVKGLAHSELMASISQSDIVVIPSTVEGFALVVGEAMCLGKPVIATKTGAIPDMIEDGVSGVLVDTNDSNKLAGAIIDLVKDKSKQEFLGRNAKEKIKEFDVSINLDKWQTFYKGLVERI